jgi:hypothetical protein
LRSGAGARSAGGVAAITSPIPNLHETQGQQSGFK